MYPVPHVTIAAGSVWLGARLWQRLWRGGRSQPRGAPAGRVTRACFDYRVVALGGLIPDLIDKPLSWFLLPDTFPDDHLYGHTLLLPAFLIACGALLAAGRGDTRLLGLGLGALSHPLVDPVVLYPQTLFWPALGTQFPDAENHIPVQWMIDVVLVTAYGALYWRCARLRDLAADFLAAGGLPGLPTRPPHAAGGGSRTAATPAMSPDADG